VVDPEGYFRLWRADRVRRDRAIERKRTHSSPLDAPEPDPAPRLTFVLPPAEPATDQEVA
jgi:hypothetical protein